MISTATPAYKPNIIDTILHTMAIVSFIRAFLESFLFLLRATALSKALAEKAKELHPKTTGKIFNIIKANKPAKNKSKTIIKTVMINSTSLVTTKDSSISTIMRTAKHIGAKPTTAAILTKKPIPHKSMAIEDSMIAANPLGKGLSNKCFFFKVLFFKISLLSYE